MPSGVYKRTKPVWNKGLTKETDIRVANYAVAKTGVPLSLEHCKALSVSHIGIPHSSERCAVNAAAQIKRYEDPKEREKISVVTRGNKNPNYRGGITPLYNLLRNSLKSKLWTKEVFIRDNFTCQECGQVGENLEVHHKKPFSVILIENNITIYEDGINCLELWDINNGITLCKKCHNKVKALTMKQIKKLRKEKLLIA